MDIKTRNAEMVERAIMNKDAELKSLLLVTGVFKHEPASLREPRTNEALDAVARPLSEETRSGKLQASPAAFGLLLEFIAKHSAANP